MSDRSIIEAIQTITKTKLSDRVYVISCEVKSVDETKRLCKCLIVEGNIENEIDVKLMPVIDDGLLLIPAISSIIKVIFSDYSEPFACQYSEITKAVLIVGSSQMKVENDLIEFNQGQLEGLIKILPLVSKLNNLENAYNDLVSKYNSHTHILTLSSGTGTAAPTTTTEGTVLEQTQKDDLENTKIKQ